MHIHMQKLIIATIDETDYIYIYIYIYMSNILYTAIYCILYIYIFCVFLQIHEIKHKMPNNKTEEMNIRMSLYLRFLHPEQRELIKELRWRYPHFAATSIYRHTKKEFF